VVEGNDLVGTVDARTPTNRVNNYTQINQKTIAVTGTLEAVEKAGMSSYLAYELSKAASEMKRDMETAVCGTQAGVAGSNSVARKTAGMGAWIITNYMPGATGTPPVMSGGAGNGYPNAAAGAGTGRAFTEALLKTAMQNVWTQGGEPKVLVTNASQKLAFSAFAGIATRYRDVPPGKQADIVGASDSYVGDFGSLSVILDRFMPTNLVYVGDPEYVSLAYLRPFATQELAKTGDAQKRMLVCEWGLRMKSQYSWATVADLT
jgi:hypothetical protein